MKPSGKIMTNCYRRWNPALSVMLMASLLFCAGCPQTTPEPVTRIEVRPPCNLPEAPVRPELPSTTAVDNAVVLSLPDARRLLSYLQRARAWMRQAAECSRPFEGDVHGRPYGGR